MNKKKAYVYVSPHFHLYGAEKSLLAILKEMKKQQKKAIVILPQKGKICSVLDNEQIEYIICRFTYNVNYLGRPRWIYGAIKYIYNFFSVIRVINKIKEYDVQFVHTNSIVTDFGTQLAAALGCPHIQHIREFGKRDFNMTFELGKKFLKKIHQKDCSVICISNAIKQEYEAIFTEKQMKVIYNGVDSGKANLEGHSLARENLVLPAKIMLIGRLSEEKGQIEAIKAIQKINQAGNVAQLDLYGDGNDRQKLQAYVSANQLENVVFFKGYCSDIPYSDYTIGLVCSNDEAFGRVTVEYMFHHLPVIGANTGATPELLDNGKVGVLYRKGDAEDLAQKIQELLIDFDKYMRIKTDAYRYARDHFSEKRYVMDIMTLYASVLRR